MRRVIGMDLYRTFAELLGQLEQSDLHPDDLLFLRHLVSPFHVGGRAAVPAQGENRVPPTGSASETNNDCKIEFKLIQITPATRCR